MFTPSQRRQLVLSFDGFLPSEGPAATVVKAAKHILGKYADKMARYLNYRDTETDCEPGYPLIPLIKPVGDHCNLRCRYCFNRPSMSPKRMSGDVLEAIIAQTLEMNLGETHFIFHGGEPLLAGIGFFETAVSFQKKHRRANQTVKNSVTTNGTLLDEEWGEFFYKNGFKVAISIDGSPAVHDKNRVDASGQGSMHRVMKGLRSVQAFNVDVSSISVVTCPPAVSPGELFEFILSLGIRKWRVNPCRSAETVHSYGPYVEKLFDHWSTAKEQIEIPIISETLQGQFGYPPNTCWMKGRCESIIGFEPDGTVSPCCEMSLEPLFHFGNIRKASLPQILNGSAARNFWADRNEGQALQCSGCEWVHLCGGGCTYQRLQYSGNVRSGDYLCDAYRDVFGRLTARIDAILANSLSQGLA